MHSTASETNYKRSILRFFKSNIEGAEGIPVTFEGEIDTPGFTDAAKWVVIDFGTIHMTGGNFTECVLYIRPCTRNDIEGLELASLRDTIIGYLSGGPVIPTRIPLYEMNVSGDDYIWTKIGDILVDDISENDILEMENGVKFKTITVILKYVSVL